MAKKTEVKVKITGDSKSVVRATKTTEGAFRKLTNFLKGSFVPLIAGGLGLRALVNVFRSVTRAAAEQESAVRSLDAALLPLGDAAAGVSQRLQEQAAALQKVTTAGDETIIKGQALIASFTKNEEEIKLATAAALDLSAAVGVELSAAFLLMGKAAAGETTTLSRYGIILGEGIPQSEKFAAALALVNEQFGGRAQEQAKTYAGVMAQISNAFGDLKEQVGASLTENAKVTAQLQRLKEILEDEGTVESVGNLAANFVALSVGAVEAANAIKTFIGPMDQAVNAQIQQTESVQALNEAINDWWTNLRDNVIETLKQLLQTTDHVERDLSELGLSFEQLAKFTDEEKLALKRLTDAFGDADKALEVFIKTQEREKRLLDELTESEDAFADATKRLGIALESEVQAAIEENNRVLELYGRRLKLGEISAEDFARAQLAIAAANRELRESLSGASDGIQEIGTFAADATRNFDVFGGSLQNTSRDFRTLTVEAQAASAAVNQFRGDFARQAAERRSRGQEGFIQFGGGTFTFQSPGVTQDPDGRLRAA